MEYTVSFEDSGYRRTGTAKDPLCIENYSTYELPGTGGSGTKILCTPGNLLIISAGILLITKKGSPKDPKKYERIISIYNFLYLYLHADIFIC